MKTDLEKLARTILFPFDSEDRKQDISEMKPTAEERLTAEEYFVRQYPVYTIRGEHIPNEITLFKEELFRMMQDFATQEVEVEIEKIMPSEGEANKLSKMAFDNMKAIEGFMYCYNWFRSRMKGGRQ